jgi:hypothetical protein
MSLFGYSRVLRVLLLALFAAASAWAQNCSIRVIAFGAHPDDSDINASGTAALLGKDGVRCQVCFGDEWRRGSAVDEAGGTGEAAAGRGEGIGAAAGH